MKLKLRIEQDEDARSPQEWGDDGLFLIADHRQFFVPPDPKCRSFDMASEIDARKKTHWIFLLEAYIHSGVVLALAGEGNFCDRRWDVSRLGVVFASKKEWRLSAKARKAAESLIEEWNQYLSGDVWGCIVEDEDGEQVDSCWGFYGREYAEEQGAEMLKCAQKHQDKLEHETAMAECIP